MIELAPMVISAAEPLYSHSQVVNAMILAFALGWFLSPRGKR